MRRGALVVTPAYATVAPDGHGGTAYFTVHNNGVQPDTLLAATVDSASQATLHTMRASGGVMRMEPLARAVIEPRDSFVLAPGGPHLMFSGFARAHKVGDTVSARLRFARAGPVQLRLPVRPFGG